MSKVIPRTARYKFLQPPKCKKRKCPSEKDPISVTGRELLKFQIRKLPGTYNDELCEASSSYKQKCGWTVTNTDRSACLWSYSEGTIIFFFTTAKKKCYLHTTCTTAIIMANCVRCRKRLSWPFVTHRLLEKLGTVTKDESVNIVGRTGRSHEGW